MATLRQRLKQSVEVERMAMEFYEALADRFPETAIWQELEASEREHVAIMQEVERSWPREKIPDEILFPCFRMIQVTYETMDHYLRRARDTELTEPSAFETAIELEHSLVEEYLQAVLKMTTHSTTLEKLQSVSSQEEYHHEILQQEYQRRFGNEGEDRAAD